MKLALAIGRLGGLRRHPAVRGMSLALALRISMTLVSFALVTLAARALGKVEFGTFSVLLSAAGLLSAFSCIGQQMFCVRAWSEFSTPDLAAEFKGAMLFSAAACIIGNLAAGLLLFVWADASFGYEPAVAIVAFMVLSSALMVTSHLGRAAIGPVFGDGVGAALPYLSVIAYLGIALATGSAARLEAIFTIMTIGGLFSLAIHVAAIMVRARRRMPQLSVIRPVFHFGAWLAQSLKLCLSTALEASIQYADVLIIGYLMNPTMAGAYFVTSRIANIFAVASGAIYIYATRNIPRLYFGRESTRLNTLLDGVAMLTLLGIAAGLVLVVVAGHWLLHLFSPDYVPYFGALVVLSVGTACATAAGPSGPVLMLTGHEGRYLRIIGLSVALRMAGFFLLIPAAGIMGAVTASTLSLVFMAVSLRQSASRLSGIDGSVLRLLRRLVPVHYAS